MGKLVVPDGFVKVDGKCANCEDAGKENLLVQAPGGASCLACGWTWPHGKIKQEVEKKGKTK